MHMNRIFEWKVRSIWISRDPALFNSEHLDTSWASIIHLSQKIWLFEFSQSFHVQFRASWYITGLNQTSDSKVMAVWICHVLPCLISSVSLYYAPESSILMKGYNCLNFPRASVVQFWASQYITGLNHTPKWKIWPYEFAQSIRVQFRASRYIMGLNHTPESKVMAVRICREL